VAHPERINPDETSAGILALHLKRYDFARSFTRDKDVLDAACGAGYGSAYLAADSARVIGVDIDAETVAHARRRYGSNHVEFRQMDVTNLAFPDSSFDVVVSFETLEHVDAPSAIQEAARVLRAGGTYVASTPCVAETSHNPQNPFHRTEYAPEDFERLLRTAFPRVELYGQHRRESRRQRLLRRLDVMGVRRRVRVPGVALVTGGPRTTDLTLDDIAIEPGAIRGASEVIAVCR
jgi:ubiquinone/menaquinone biosynthesis C-methylase UbiE